MERRRFLTVAGLAGLAAGCTDESPASVPSPTVEATGGAVTPTGPADWEALGRGLAGRLVRPGDDAYDEARKLYIPRFDRVRPAGVAYCAGPEDVSECVAFARRQRLSVAVRCGGHNYAGWSTGGGLVIDVSPMNAVQAGGGRATVGAGARLIDVYKGLTDRGVAVPAGTCPTVGIAGLALGGGIGVVSRRHGLTCDVLEAVRVVTADGRVRDCDARRDADLYWACRGGGGGNFGVAVQFVFRTHPAAEVTLFSLRWPWPRAAQVVGGWQSWAPYAPDELWSGLQINTDPSAGTPTVDVTGAAFGDPDAHLDRLTAAVGADPAFRSVDTHSYLEAMRRVGGCADGGIAACHRAGTLPGGRPDGRYPRTEYTAKSHVATRPLTGSAIEALTGRFTGGNGVAGRSVLLDALGGAVGRVRPGDTAFPHRNALFTVQYLAGTGDRGWLRDVHGAMERHLGGAAYVNYVDPELRGWQRAYYGGNYERLVRVKNAYDPDGLFTFPQSIG
ncbi:FAD/FMN-containing dehydrogenase [Thermomonospora echinospora]|uniref:FAD/FMN-containing dehydrogenase n=1 Tax=Thermomonospora echinospora TaxID=1992 RepID=A0A1H5V8U9_9ACTN|nr:FAD-binding oxidoreductase [Thermomonospora echinospora]SEF83640.1 FAD/FMN-containing dehydrogenase [Thermomonospora echinospora]